MIRNTLMRRKKNESDALSDPPATNLLTCYVKDKRVFNHAQLRHPQS